MRVALETIRAYAIKPSSEHDKQIRRRRRRQRLLLLHEWSVKNYDLKPNQSTVTWRRAHTCTHATQESEPSLLASCSIHITHFVSPRFDSPPCTYCTVTIASHCLLLLLHLLNIIIINIFSAHLILGNFYFWCHIFCIYLPNTRSHFVCVWCRVHGKTYSHIIGIEENNCNDSNRINNNNNNTAILQNYDNISFWTLAWRQRECKKTHIISIGPRMNSMMRPTPDGNGESFDTTKYIETEANNYSIIIVLESVATLEATLTHTSFSISQFHFVQFFHIQHRQDQSDLCATNFVDFSLFFSPFFQYQLQSP